MGDGAEAPLTARGKRTREQLLAAAAEVFAERQYLATNVADIVQRAGVAHGTFYRYFDSKEAIFREVGRELQQEMLRTGEPGELAAVPTFASPAEEMLWRVTRANRRYLAAYQQHRHLLAVFEQVATFNDDMREMRRRTRAAFVSRAERRLTDLQERGLAHRDVDARYAANALGSMVDRFAYVWLVLDEPFELDESAYTLSVLWCRSIGLEVPTDAGRVTKRSGR